MADAIARRSYDFEIRNKRRNAQREINDIIRAAGRLAAEPGSLSDAEVIARAATNLVGHLSALTALEAVGFLAEPDTEKP